MDSWGPYKGIYGISGRGSLAGVLWGRGLRRKGEKVFVGGGALEGVRWLLGVHERKNKKLLEGVYGKET